MIRIQAEVTNHADNNHVTLTTNGKSHSITILPKTEGLVSSANGGELLFLALATCYCNDIYREAKQRNIHVARVKVQVQGEFAPKAGSIAENVTYTATVEADASEADILDLIQHTDTVAEVQNTLRKGIHVQLVSPKAISS